MNEVIISNWTHEASALAGAVKQSLAAADAHEEAASEARWEAAKGIAALVKQASTREVAERIGRSQSFVTRYARVWDLKGSESSGLSFSEAMSEVRAGKNQEDDYWTPANRRVLVLALGGDGRYRTFYTVSFGPARFYVQSEELDGGEMLWSLTTCLADATFYRTPIWEAVEAAGMDWTPPTLRDWVAEHCPGGKLAHEDLVSLEDMG